MSTLAIREALDYLENNPTADEAQAARRRARAEVEAIERAAKIYADREWMLDNVDWLWIRSLMKSIAKDAP